MLKKALLLIAALAGAGAVLYCLRSAGLLLPGWVVWEGATFSDRSGQYTVSLEHKTVSVFLGDTLLWTSPKGVKVQKALSADIDNDGGDELVLLCWKKGRYGKHRPFWVEEDEAGWSQHIFVYEYGPDGVRPKWMSSYIGLDVADMASNGREAPWGRLWLTDLSGEMSSWVWGSWGFSREETDVTFIVFGDILAHEPIYRYGLLHEEGFGFLFENMLQVIADSDVSVINQETPLTDNPSLYGDYPRFGTPVQVGWAVAEAGFDVVTCATNHILDRGVEGMAETKAFFDSRGIECIGIRARGEDVPYVIIRRKGIRFALLNYTYGTNGIRIPDESPWVVGLLEDEDRVRGDIARAREEADFVIVFAHWGTEHSGQASGFQRQWAEVFLESGVDVVVGTHPHALQPCEVLEDENGRKMLVYYSIGNYISAQREKSCTKGGMASFTVSLTPQGYKVTEYKLLPLTITWQGGGKYTVDF